jgi:MFS family permease
VKEELQRVTEVPDPLSARFSDEAHELGDLESPGKLNKGEPYTRTLHRIFATLLVCLVAFVATLASSIDSAVLTRATADFGVSEVAESLATALFLVGFGFGALLLSPLSELLGRYPVYLGSLFVFACWTLGSALAPNFGAQIVFRFLAGFSASTPLTVAGGSVGDLWSPVEKTFAFPLFAIPAFGGPVLGKFVILVLFLSRRSAPCWFY